MSTDDEAVRRWLLSIFGPKPEDDTPPTDPPKPTGHADGEGVNPTPKPDADAELRQFANELFGYDD